MLLDDLHPTQGYSGRAGHLGSAGPGHRQTDGGGHHEEVWMGGGIQGGGAELLAEDPAQDMGPL